MSERPSTRRNAYAPPAEVQRAIVKRNPKAKAAPAVAVESTPPVLGVVKPLRPSTPGGDLELTQQDAVDLVFALTESIEGANANVQRWAQKGDPHRMDAALIQAKRFETLRDRIASVIPKLSRKG